MLLQRKTAKAVALCLALGPLLALAPPSPARADFGFSQAEIRFVEEDGSPATAAGSHPSVWSTTVAFNTITGPGGVLPDQALKDLRIQLPPGLVGTPALVPRCSHLDFISSRCPLVTVVGDVVFDLGEGSESPEPLYNLEPLAGAVAELAFNVKEVPVLIRLSLNSRPPYNLIAEIADATNEVPLFGATLNVKGVMGGSPFLTLPRTCAEPPAATFEADSWERPGLWAPAVVAQTEDDAEPPRPLALTSCGELRFEPLLKVRPTTAEAASGSGLDLEVDMPVEAIESPAGLAQADLRGVVLRFPPGMTVNPAIAAGLDTCTPAALARETIDSDPGAGCPGASKIGTARVESPLLERPLEGSLFVAEPDDPTTVEAGAENPFDALLAFYVVLKDAERGILLEQPVRVDVDPSDGHLTAAVADLPQLPFSHLELHIRTGARSPLATPPRCGDHVIRSSLVPSSGAPALEEPQTFDLDGRCGAGGFDPSLSAGVSNPRAGAASPFVLELKREDGEQNPSRLSIAFPAGLVADFATVPLCPSHLAVTGLCPEASRVGEARVAAGVGAAPAWIPSAGETPGKVFLAGPYHGAPFSLSIVVPAVAGPFDLGTLAIRAPIFVDPMTARAEVRLDGLPQILRGIPIAYRTVRLVLDRPGFVRNPTSCAPSAVRATVISTAGSVASVSTRFQVGDCARLPFKPKLSMRLLGPTRRGAHPRLRIGLRQRPGDANLRRVSVTLPGAELLETRRIGDVCSRAEFVAGSCPPGSAYGRAKAWTPLLDRPLEGPVYLRESKGRLPDLAVALGGHIDLDLTANLDTARGRMRITFETLPDTPLQKVVVTMAGGKKGMLVNSGGVCSHRQQVRAEFLAHSGRRRHVQPVVATDCRP